MEDEFTSTALPEEVSMWVGEPLASFSEIWVGQVHEILRSVLDRNLIDHSDPVKELAHDFRLLRISIEKHEIAQDRSLIAPLPMSRTPAAEGEVDYHHDKTDRLRAHTMPSGISGRGSMQWLAVDISGVLKQRWIERPDLSDRFLQLLCP